MSLESWAQATGVPLPKCKMTGCCCRAASPSVPFYQLLEKAAKGEDFARNFFSIFIPHVSHKAAEASVPGMVEKTLAASKKDPHFKSDEDVVFYHCQFLAEHNICQIYEDRPDLCRDYPDTPFVVFAPECGFKPWAMKARDRVSEIKAELADLKALQASNSISMLESETPDLFALSMLLLLTPVYLSSPMGFFLY